MAKGQLKRATHKGKSTSKVMISKQQKPGGARKSTYQGKNMMGGGSGAIKNVGC